MILKYNYRNRLILIRNGFALVLGLLVHTSGLDLKPHMQKCSVHTRPICGLQPRASDACSVHVFSPSWLRAC